MPSQPECGAAQVEATEAHLSLYADRRWHCFAWHAVQRVAQVERHAAYRYVVPATPAQGTLCAGVLTWDSRVFTGFVMPDEYVPYEARNSRG